jgi:hypothetical protein
MKQGEYIVKLEKYETVLINHEGINGGLFGLRRPKIDVS